jgi:hypothetical protein
MKLAASMIGMDNIPASSDTVPPKITLPNKTPKAVTIMTYDKPIKASRRLIRMVYASLIFAGLGLFPQQVARQSKIAMTAPISLSRIIANIETTKPKTLPSRLPMFLRTHAISS